MNEYPNSSEALQPWSPEEPVEKTKAVEKENRKVTSSVGVIKDVLKWFEANSVLYSSIDGLGITESTTGEDTKVAVLTAKKLKAAYESKGIEFRNEFKKFLKDADEADAE